MRTYLHALVHSLLASVAGLIAGCVLVGIAIGLHAQFESPDRFTTLSGGWGAGLFVTVFAVIYGFFPSLLYGAPLYALLLNRGHANFLSALAIGVSPGLVLLATGSDWAGLFLMYGVAVSLCTHLFAWRFQRSKAPAT
jgi:hypothetical protein